MTSKRKSWAQVEAEVFATARAYQALSPDAKLQHDARHQARLRAEFAPIVARHEATMATATPLGAAVLTLHAPTGTGPHATCAGCDVDGWEAETHEWPCRTYRLVRDWPDAELSSSRGKA